MRAVYALILSLAGAPSALAGASDIELTVTPLSQTITREHKPTVKITITNNLTSGIWASHDGSNYTSCHWCAQYAPYLKIRDEDGHWPELTVEGEELFSHRNAVENPATPPRSHFLETSSFGYRMAPHESDSVTFNLNDLCVLAPGHTYSLSFGRDIYLDNDARTKLHVQSNTVSITVK